MLLLAAPLLLTLFATVVAAAPLAFVRVPAGFERRAALVQLCLVGLVVAMAFFYPRRPTSQGPTCPNTGTGYGLTVGAVALCAALAGGVVIAGALARRSRRSLIAPALILPYVAAAAYVIPSLCDYS